MSTKWQGIQRGSLDVSTDMASGLLAVNTRFKIDGEMRRRRGMARTNIIKKGAAVKSLGGFSAFQSNVMAALVDGSNLQGYQQPAALWGDNPDYTPIDGGGDVYAAAYGGQSYTTTGGVTATYTPSFQTGGVFINCMRFSSPNWYASSTNGRVYVSDDAVTWAQLATGISTPSRMATLGPVIVVCDFTTGVKLSLDYGATWSSHVPYTNATKTFQSVHIKEISGGVYRIFVGGQAGGGYGSGILAYADSNSMPTAGASWSVAYTSATVATVYCVARGHDDGVILATTVNTGRIGLAYSADNGATWALTDTGVSAANGRSAMWSDTLGVYLIGATAGGSTGSLYSATSAMGTVTLLWSDFGGAVDSITDTRGSLYCTCNAGGYWTFDLSSHTKLASGTMQFIGGKGHTV